MCRCQNNKHATEHYWGRWERLWLGLLCSRGDGRTLWRGVRPFLRSKELTERWVCPFSRCEWRDHLSYSSTLPVARPGSRGGRWLTPLSFFSPTHPKARFCSPVSARLLWPLSLTPAAAPPIMILEFFLRSDSAMLCSLLHRAATLCFWVEVDLPGYGEAFIEFSFWKEKKSLQRKTQADLQCHGGNKKRQSAQQVCAGNCDVRKRNVCY